MESMTKHEKFLEDPRYAEFMRRGVSKGTLSVDKRSMRLYLEYYLKKKEKEITPSDLLTLIEEDRKKDHLDRGNPEREWLGFAKWLETEYRKHDAHQVKTNGTVSNATIRLYCASIRGFYSYFGFTLTKIAKLPRKIRKGGGRFENEKIEYRPKTVKKLLSVMKSNRDKALALVMFQSGMDISTALSLTYGHVRNGIEKGESPLLVRVSRQKIGSPYRTCLGKDALNAIAVYLKERTASRYRCTSCESTYADKRNICPNCQGTNLKEYQEKLKSDTPIFNAKHNSTKMMSSNFQRMMKKYALLAGLVREEDMERADLNPARPHALRAAFESILSLQGTNQGLIDYLMGHETQYSGAYMRISNEEIRQLYTKNEKFLSLQEIQEISDLEKRFTEKIKMQETIIKGLQAQMKEMEEEQRKRTEARRQVRERMNKYDPETLELIFQTFDQTNDEY